MRARARSCPTLLCAVTLCITWYRHVPTEPLYSRVLPPTTTAWGKGKGPVAKVIECVEAHYEVEDVVMGKVYRWCPESVVVECTCGKRETFTASSTALCSECEAEHADIVREVWDVGEEEGKEYHLWRSLHPYYKPTRGT
jgi:hypothetical protein